MAKLLLFLQDGSSQEILLDKDRVTIGRRNDNDVPLPYPAVSGRHAVFSVLPPDRCFIEDLKSTNGTMLNSKPIKERVQIKDRDQIDIGGQKFVYLEGKARAVATKAPELSLADKESPITRSTATASAEATPKAPDLSLSASHSYISTKARTPMTADTQSPVPEVDLDDDEEHSGLHFPTIFKASSDGKKKTVIKTEPSPLPTLDASLVAPVVDDMDLDSSLPSEDSSISMPKAVAVIEAFSGPNNERRLILRPGEYVLGRPGLQLAVVRVTEDECRLLPMEGEPPLELRGETVPEDGMLLEDQDQFVVGRSPLRFIRLPQGD